MRATKPQKKQTIMIALIVLALLFLAYQLMKLVTDDMNIQPAKKVPNVAVQAPAPIVRVNEKQNVPVVPLARIEENKLVTTTLVRSQQEYIKMVNLYELAKMKRQLLNEEAAIAEAQDRIAKLNKDTQQITGANQNNPFITASNNNGSYQLNYVDQQNGQWHAILNYNGQYQQVTVGTLLPDGNHVITINDSGVILRNQKQQLLVTFNGTVLRSTADKHS